MTARVLAALLLLGTGASRVSEAQLLPFSALTERRAPSADVRASYGAAPQQVGELYLPRGGGRAPVVALLHGGCWRAEYDRAYMRHVAGALRDDGYAVWLPEFRRIGDAGGGWPGTFLDVAAAVDHLRRLAERHPLDLSRVITAGHSAGGHLALWVAARDRIAADSPLAASDPLPIHAVVGIAAITDLAAYAAPSGCGSAVAPLLGGAPAEVPDRLAAASPTRLAGAGTPAWLVLGDRDPIVPMSQADALAAAFPSRRVQIVPAPHAGHFEVVAPWTPAYGAVRDAVRAAIGTP